MDEAVNLLKKAGWNKDEPMRVKDEPDRPVFRKGKYTVVVGPLWTTHYRMDGSAMEDNDSVKTADLDAVEARIKTLK